jgi:HipA-like protein
MSEISQPYEIAEPLTSPELQYQRTLFPVEIIEFYPNDQGSADLSLIGSGRNAKDYAIKRISDGRGMVPATELFCYELARRVNIATPDFDIVLLADGELAFGSVWEGGVHRISNMNEVTKILMGTIQVKSLDNFFGKVYAFDLFINNIDRHFGNFLFRQSHSYFIALAYDYSRAWYEVDYKGFQATDKQSKTQQVNELIRKFHKFNRQQAVQTLDELCQISQSSIEHILTEIPVNWMTKQQREEIIEWWGTDEFASRFVMLNKEISNVLV